MTDIRLFVGGDGTWMCGERITLGGDRCFSPVNRPRSRIVDPVAGLLDSGAFSDDIHRRLMFDQALDRQLLWELRASNYWGRPWQAERIVSYDVLIDETWVAGERHKRRWSVQQADWAIRTTIEAADYLSGQRDRLMPRRLVLACQGVDAIQYEECVIEVLKGANPGDWIGLGGWCILGRFTSYMPAFWATLYRILPRIAAAGLSHVHIFGVLYPPALGGLLWLADRHGLTVSTDSSSPLVVPTRKDVKKSGARVPGSPLGNVEYWKAFLSELRTSPHYRRPPNIPAIRQQMLDLDERMAA